MSVFDGEPSRPGGRLAQAGTAPVARRGGGWRAAENGPFHPACLRWAVQPFAARLAAAAFVDRCSESVLEMLRGESGLCCRPLGPRVSSMSASAAPLQPPPRPPRKPPRPPPPPRKPPPPPRAASPRGISGWHLRLTVGFRACSIHEKEGNGCKGARGCKGAKENRCCPQNLTAALSTRTCSCWP